MMTNAIRVLPLVLALVAPGVTAAPLPAVLLDNVPALSQVGAGEGRKFSFHIYDVSLWARDSRFAGRLANLSARDVVALHIEYKRRISGNLLVKAAVRAWKRMSELDPYVRAAWSRRAETIWPDVNPGDSITTLVVPGKETRFYSRDKLLGVIDDPAFGPAFLAIWLDPRAQDKKLRAALLGRQVDQLRVENSPSSAGATWINRQDASLSR